MALIAPHSDQTKTQPPGRRKGIEIVLQGQCPLESGDLGVILAPLGELRLITFSPGFSSKSNVQDL